MLIQTEPKLQVHLSFQLALKFGERKILTKGVWLLTTLLGSMALHVARTDALASQFIFWHLSSRSYVHY